MEQLKQLYAAWAGVACEECVPLGANGSSRRYYRLTSAEARSAIGCIADDVRENEAFFAYSRHFRAKGLSVPELYAIDDDRRHYLQQDLGDLTLYGLLQEKKRQGGGFDAQMFDLYRQALAHLADFQLAGRDLDYSVAYPRPAFDRRSILWDLNYFKYYFLKLKHIPFDEELLENDFDQLVQQLLSADDNYFMYRDFNPRNIMLVGGEQPTPYFIDYQGGRRGASQYDVASLLYSAQSNLPDAIRLQLLNHYLDARHFSVPERQQWLDHFWRYLLVRILQTLGAYGYRGLYERKEYFLQSIPLALNNLRTLLESHPPQHLPHLSQVLAYLVQSAPQPVAPAPGPLTVQILSFSYKQGLPTDLSGNGGGFIFDCRALPNPGRYEQYKSYTGQHPSVIAFLQKEDSVAQFIHQAADIVIPSINKYIERHFTHLQIAFGCTGGQHRSVYCAEQLAALLRHRYPNIIVDVHHREQDK